MSFRFCPCLGNTFWGFSGGHRDHFFAPMGPFCTQEGPDNPQKTPRKVIQNKTAKGENILGVFWGSTGLIFTLANAVLSTCPSVASKKCGERKGQEHVSVTLAVWTVDPQAPRHFATRACACPRGRSTLKRLITTLTSHTPAATAVRVHRHPSPAGACGIQR